MFRRHPNLLPTAALALTLGTALVVGLQNALHQRYMDGVNAANHADGATDRSRIRAQLGELARMHQQVRDAQDGAARDRAALIDEIRRSAAWTARAEAERAELRRRVEALEKAASPAEQRP